MKVISCFDSIEDGMITSVTMKCENDGNIIQETTFDIIDSGRGAVIRSNKLFVVSEDIIKKSFCEIAATLKKQDVSEIFAVSADGSLSKVAAF